jgi:hypothetical protein
MIAKPKPQHGVIFARGGSGPANRMVREQAAGPAKAGITGKKQTPAPGAKQASGGPKTPRGVSAAVPASAGHTAPRKR